MKENDKHIQDVWDSAECLFKADELEQGVSQMAQRIRKDLHDCNPLLLCLMNGGLVTCGQVLPLLDFQLQLEYVQAAGGRATRAQAKQPGAATLKTETRWPALSQISLQNRRVLLIDDIFDRGVSLQALKDYCVQQGAQSVQTAVLVEKQHQRYKQPIKVDYKAVQVDDRFIFGTGLDYKGQLRNAPGIYAVNEQGSETGT